MKQAMNFDANQTNILHAYQLQTERMNHLRRLNTIYREKNGRNHSFQQTEGKNYMFLHLKNKEKDLQRKQKSLQHQIDYENQILRTKLIQAALPKHLKSRLNHHNDNSNDTSGSIKTEKRPLTHKKENHKSQSFIKKQEKTKIIEENAKLFVKLAAIKSDLMERLNLKDHQKKTEQIKDKLQKRSPKKMKMMRSFFKKRNLQHLPSAAKHHHDSIQNQEDQT